MSPCHYLLFLTSVPILDQLVDFSPRGVAGGLFFVSLHAWLFLAECLTCECFLVGCQVFYISVGILDLFPWDTVKLLGNLLIPLGLAVRGCQRAPEQHCC